MPNTPNNDPDQLKFEDPWRVFKIMAEFVSGFDQFAQIKRGVTIFGSARTAEDHEMYQKAEQTAQLFVDDGYAVITGGGPGIMEAGNKGATEADGMSFGLNIDLPFEQKPNRFIKTLINFHYFFIRKVMFLKYAKAFVVFPGGFGTLDEFFECVTLIQTKRMVACPVVLVGTQYWSGLIEWINARLLGGGMISPDDMNLFHLVDEPKEVVKIVDDFYKE